MVAQRSQMIGGGFMGNLLSNHWSPLSDQWRVWKIMAATIQQPLYHLCNAWGHQKSHKKGFLNLGNLPVTWPFFCYWKIALDCMMGGLTMSARRLKTGMVDTKILQKEQRASPSVLDVFLYVTDSIVVHPPSWETSWVRFILVTECSSSASRIGKLVSYTLSVVSSCGSL